MANINTEDLGIFNVDFEEIDALTLKHKKLKSKHISYPINKVPSQGNMMLEKVLTITDTIKRYRKKVY